MTDHGAATRGVNFLLGAQDADGAWRDFALEPGASDSWLTAFVALGLTRVARCGDATPHAESAHARQRAVDFLVAQARADDTGLPVWGYNARVPPDADSTAHVALLLHAVGHRLASDAARALLAWVRPDGGVATFRRRSASDGWGHAHADVTAVAMRALHHTGVADDAVARALQYLLRCRHDSGLWPSYWWTTDWFATAAALRACRDMGHACDTDLLATLLLAATPDAPPFDLALQLATWRLSHAGPDREHDLVQSLYRTQRADGSWNAVPRLRVTDPRLPIGTTVPTGPVAADAKCLYTTAHVLHALASATNRRGVSVELG